MASMTTGLWDTERTRMSSYGTQGLGSSQFGRSSWSVVHDGRRERFASTEGRKALSIGRRYHALQSQSFRRVHFVQRSVVVVVVTVIATRSDWALGGVAMKAMALVTGPSPGIVVVPLRMSV